MLALLHQPLGCWLLEGSPKDWKGPQGLAMVPLLPEGQGQLGAPYFHFPVPSY